MSKKRYSIMPDFAGTSWSEACKRVQTLEADIKKLLIANGLTPADHFHEFVEPIEGAPSVLLECTEAFFEKVKTLPLFDTAHVLGDEVKTVSWNDSFSAPPPAQSKKPPRP